MGWREQLRNPKTAGRAMLNIGGMQRYDQSHGYYTPDMSMRGGAMYKRGGGVTGTKKKQSLEHKKKPLIRSHIKDVLSGKYMGDGSRGTAEDPSWKWKSRIVRKRAKKFGGGRIGLKKGGDSKWIQKATASIKKRGTEGKCTPITKKGCTGRAKALAKTFKKMAKKRKAA